MLFELSGTVKEIFDEQTFASGFSKREFVVTTQADKFPQDIKFECLKEKVELVDKLKKGDKVKVSFNLSGREWQGKYFVNLEAWRIESAPASEDDNSDSNDEILDEEPPF